MKPSLLAGHLALICLLSVLIGCASTPSNLDRIAVGEPLLGTLDATDELLPSGEYYDLYVFNGQAGDEYEIRLASEDFDTYLIFLDPEQSQTDNDDLDGTDSGLDVTLTSSGRCGIGVTSYSRGLSGAYTLTLTKTN